MPHTRLFIALLAAVLLLGGIGLWLSANHDNTAVSTTSTAVSPTPQNSTILFPLEAKQYLQAVTITAHTSGQKATFERTATNEWQQTAPQSQPADKTSFVNPLNYLLDQPSRRALTIDQHARLAEYGLNAPPYTLAFGFAPTNTPEDMADMEWVTLDVGRETPTGDGFYIKLSTDAQVHVVFKTGLVDLLETVSPAAES